MPPFFLFAANPTTEKQQLLNKSNIADLKNSIISNNTY